MSESSTRSEADGKQRWKSGMPVEGGERQQSVVSSPTATSTPEMRAGLSTVFRKRVAPLPQCLSHRAAGRNHDL